MSDEQAVIIPALPAPLHWRGTPQNWLLDETGALSITAGERTDWFVDPGGAVNILNAPALLTPVQRPCMLKAFVHSASAATFDAGVLAIYQGADQWAKLCLELSPQKQVTIVSVVTKGTSDDCNSVPINGESVHLRVSVLEKAFAFHYSVDGTVWNLVRYFTLDSSDTLEIGFLSQSPIGEGCTATFTDISYLPEKLADIRSGV